MKRILVLIVAAIALVGVSGVQAQSRTSYFMEGATYRNDLNPALAPTRGYLALPLLSGVSMNATTNFLSVDNFIYQKNGQTVTALHGSVSSDEFFKKLPSLGKATFDLKTNLLGVGFYAKKMFWTFGFNMNVSGDMAMSMDMFKAVKQLGNGLYDLGDTALEANAYFDAYLGTSFYVHENVSVGVKLKFLVGLATIDAQFSQFEANVDPDAVTGQLRGTWRANGAFIDNSQLRPGNMTLADAFSTNPAYILNNVKNYGLAVDLGTEVRLLDDHLKISAAITDLGFIKWGGRSHIAGVAQGDFYYNGVNFDTQEVDAGGNFSTEVSDVSNSKGYTTMVNMSLNAGVEYNILNNHIAFGLLSHTKFCNTMTYSELIASVNFRATNWLSATFSHTFLSGNRPGVLGFALNIHPEAVNIFLGADYIDTRYVKGPTINGMQPLLGRYTKSLNLYAGMSFNFGRPKHLRASKK